MPTQIADTLPDTEYVIDQGIPYGYLGMLLAGVVFVILLLAHLACFVFGSHHGIRPGYFIVPLLILLTGCLTSSRTVIRFDLLRRRYTLKRGLPIFSWYHWPFFEDIRSVCCEDNKNHQYPREFYICGGTWQFGGQARWTIYIEWTDPARKNTVLSGSDSEFETSDISTDVSKKLSIPFFWTGSDDQIGQYTISIDLWDHEEPND